MSVEAFTVDGKVTIDTTPFESGIAKVTTQLSELSGSMKSMMEMGGGNWNFNGALNGLKTLKDDIAVIKQDIATMNTEFANTKGIETLRSEILELRREIDAIKQKVNETTTQTVQRVREVKTEISAITSGTEPLVQLWSAMNGQIAEHYDILGIYNSEIGQINAQWRETQGLVEKNTAFMKEIEVSGSNIAKYFTHETQILERNVSLLEQEAELTNLLTQKSKQNATTISNISRELSRVANFSKEIGTYFANEEQIHRMSLRYIQEEEMLEKEKLSLYERQTMFLEQNLAIQENRATSIYGILNGEKDELAILEQAVKLEEERLAIEKAQTSEVAKQNSERNIGNKSNKNQLDKTGYLPSRIGSMALTMWGFNEIMDIYETTSANLNARGSMKYFGDQLMKDERYLTQTNQTLGDVRRGLQGFGTDLDALQKKYQKIDMTVIGANAEETAYKYGVSTESLGELAEAYAIYGSEFVKQGRTQEDSVLAINDALDGEVRRLKEVNIGMDDLVAHGYDGSTESMVKALNEIAKERGYDVTAQNITNLSDAITVLELKISQGLASAFEYIEPLLREVAMDFIYMIDAITWAFGKLNRLWIDFSTELDKTFGVRNVQKFGSSVVRVLGAVVTLAITFGIVYKIVKSVKGALKGLFGMLGKGTDDIAKTTGDVAKTGGTVGKDSGGGFKENFKSEWGKLGKNLGKMARVFVEFAVALAMAWALIEEAIILISAIGYTYESLKPQFESGINFIKEFGVWFALLGGAMLVFSYAIGKVPESAMQTVTKGAVKLATGMAIAMGLIAEAIGLLILPLGAIIILGATYNWQQSNVESGLKVIKGVGTVLNTIASDDSIMVFLLGFMAVSTIMAYGGAELIALPLAIGMAVTMGLIAEAIGLLILPLGAIALLGASASALNEENINQGAETIRMIGRVLKVLSSAMVDLFIVDIATLGVMLTEKASQLLTGKTGLQALTDDIIPSLTDFISDFNGLDMGEPVDQAKVQAIQQMATDIPPLFQAIQKVNNALGTSDAVGNIFGALGGGISGAIGMGLSSKLDQLYNDIKDVMDFANKLGGLGTGGNANTTAIQQTANAITQLKTKLNLFITTISGASARVQSASQKLGNALPTGFKTGSASFGSAVVSVLAKGVSEIQSRYATFNNGGKTLGQKLIDGFKNHKPTLKTITSREIGYALTELDNAKDDFYNKGKSLGEELTRGYQDGADIHSPGLIARTTARELRYTMDALDTGKKMMYQGGVALGQALTNGYNSYGNLRTDVGVLASKGVSNEQLQANAKNTQLNGNHKGQTPQLTQTNINIDMSNSTVIGVQDLDNKIRQAVEKAIVSINSPNGAIGY